MTENESVSHPPSPVEISHVRDIRGLTLRGIGTIDPTVAELDTKHVVLSTYVLPGLHRTLKLLPVDSVVLGPVYLSKDKSHFVDTQPAVTGSRVSIRSKLGSFLCEPSRNAVVRELTEELGIWCREDKLIQTAEFVERGKETITFSLNVSDAIAYNPEIHKSKSHIGKDNRSKKVQVVVYGDPVIARKLVNSVTSRRIAKDTSGIGGIRIMNVTDVVNKLA